MQLYFCKYFVGQTCRPQTACFAGSSLLSQLLSAAEWASRPFLRTKRQAFADKSARPAFLFFCMSGLFYKFAIFWMGL